MKILICDDEQAYLDDLHTQVRAYMEEWKIRGMTRLFWTSRWKGLLAL